MHACLTVIELQESLRPSRTVYHARLRCGTAGVDAEYATSGSNMQYGSAREGKAPSGSSVVALARTRHTLSQIQLTLATSRHRTSNLPSRYVAMFARPTRALACLAAVISSHSASAQPVLAGRLTPKEFAARRARVMNADRRRRRDPPGHDRTSRRAAVPAGQPVLLPHRSRRAAGDGDDRRQDAALDALLQPFNDRARTRMSVRVPR